MNKICLQMIYNTFVERYAISSLIYLSLVVLQTLLFKMNYLRIDAFICNTLLPRSERSLNQRKIYLLTRYKTGLYEAFNLFVQYR